MIKVIEIGHIVAGPTAGLLFHDLGFEVIKVEPLSGEKGRNLRGTSIGVFPQFNRGKKSIALDMESQEGQDILRRLILKADLLVDNLSPGYLDSIGLSYEHMAQLNTKLIIISLKGYGPGPYQNKKSLDFPIEVESGIAYMNGLTGRPLRFGSSVVDISVAMIGVMWGLTALLNRGLGNSERIIRIGMYETAAFIMGQHISAFQLLNEELKPFNEEGFAWGIYDFFLTNDGKKIFIAITSDRQWIDFCEILELSTLNDANYVTNNLRLKNRERLIPIIADRINQIHSQFLIDHMEDKRISYAMFNKPWDLLLDKHMSYKFAKVRYMDKDIFLATTPGSNELTSSVPELGEDSIEILMSLGYSEDEVEYFFKKGIVINKKDR